MHTITITSPDNIEIEYRLAGAGARLAAIAIDLLLQLAMFLIVTAGLLFFLYKSAQASDMRVFYDIPSLEAIMRYMSGYVTALAVLVYFMIYFGYFVICEMVMNGQSPGKKLFKLRVIRENGQPISLTQSMIRNIFRYFIDMWGIGLALIMFTKKCKRIGDMAASTLVIAEHPKRITIESLILADIEEAATITGVAIDELSPDEYYLVKEYLQRRNNFPDKGEHIRQELINYFSGQ